MAAAATAGCADAADAGVLAGAGADAAAGASQAGVGAGAAQLVEFRPNGNRHRERGAPSSANNFSCPLATNVAIITALNDHLLSFIASLPWEDLCPDPPGDVLWVTELTKPSRVFPTGGDTDVPENDAHQFSNDHRLAW